MSRKLEAIYAQFLKLLESGKKLTIEEIEKAVNFKKLSETEQKTLKDLLTSKIDLLKKQSKTTNKNIKKSETAAGAVKSKRNKLAAEKLSNSDKSKKKLKKANRRKRKQMRKSKK